MTNYVGRTIVPIRKSESYQGASGAAVARGELRARIGSGSRGAPLQCSAGPPRPGGRRAGGWASGRPDTPIQAEPALFRSEGSRGLPEPIGRARGGTPTACRLPPTASTANGQACVKLSQRSGIGEVAAVVASALKHAGIRAVLTGGACATLYQPRRLSVLRSGLHPAVSGFPGRPQCHHAEHRLSASRPVRADGPRRPVLPHRDASIRPIRIGGPLQPTVNRFAAPWRNDGAAPIQHSIHPLTGPRSTCRRDCVSSSCHC